MSTLAGYGLSIHQPSHVGGWPEMELRALFCVLQRRQRSLSQDNTWPWSGYKSTKRCRLRSQKFRRHPRNSSSFIGFLNAYSVSTGCEPVVHVSYVNSISLKVVGPPDSPLRSGIPTKTLNNYAFLISPMRATCSTENSLKIRKN